MSLSQYTSKRDFRKSGEPPGQPRPRKPRRSPAFIIQKHAASRLHYDFRLEMDGVLKSWAVPKGLPMAQSEKRLAMQVEDHPLEYGAFEGTIPPGNYGAGTVMLWDAGTYDLLNDSPVAALRAGKLVLNLKGHKVKGHWTLVRMRPAEHRHENAWLLIKTEETVRPISVRADDTSVKSGRTMKQITANTGPASKTRPKTLAPTTRPGRTSTS
jgi:bifunctional non-homologous end joining protein LigD